MKFKVGDVVTVTDFSFSQIMTRFGLKELCSNYGNFMPCEVVLVNIKLPSRLGSTNDILVKGQDGLHAFMCSGQLEYASPRIEIDVRINGKPAKLSDISDETFRNLKEAE